MSNSQDLVLTFKAAHPLSITTCEGNTALISDQGVAVEFLSNITSETLMEKIQQRIKLTGNLNRSNNDFIKAIGRANDIYNGIFQAMAFRMDTLVRDSFWKSYLYACNALAEYFEILKGLIQEHPTPTLRYLLKNPNIYARSGLNILEIFSCTQLAPSKYTLLAMNDTCTTHIPIRFEYINQYHEAFLDTLTNTIMPTSGEVSCLNNMNRPVRLGGNVSLYNPHSGQLTKPANIETLKLANIKLNTSALKIPEVLFRSATLIDWNDLQSHHSLNDIFATAARQRKVLKAIGITWDGSTENDATESINKIFEKGFFSFITGGHIGSPWEIFVFVICMIVTVSTLIKIIKCCHMVKRRGVREVIREIRTEGGRDRDSMAHLAANETIVTKITPLSKYSKLYRDLSKLALPQKAVETGGDILYIPIQLAGETYHALWDSGSSISLIGEMILNEVDSTVQKTRINATGVTGAKLPLIGEITLTTTLGPNEVTHNFAVFKGHGKEIILG